MEQQTYVGTLVVETCFKCGIAFGMPADYQRRRREDHASFCCPSGHWQHYAGESETEQLRAKLALANSSADQFSRWYTAEHEKVEKERRRLRAAKGQMTKLKKRIANGMCPCCNRTFRDLQRHMVSKHPDYPVTVVEGRDE